MSYDYVQLATSPHEIKAVCTYRQVDNNLNRLKPCTNLYKATFWT